MAENEEEIYQAPIQDDINKQNNGLAVEKNPIEDTIDVLKKLNRLSDISSLSESEREKLRQSVEQILSSALVGENMTPEKMREDKMLIDEMANKGLDIAQEAKETIEKQESNITSDNINSSDLQDKVHLSLKDYLRQQANFGKGDETENRSDNTGKQQENQMMDMPQKTSQGNSILDYAARVYATDSPERAKFNSMGPDKDRNKGHTR